MFPVSNKNTSAPKGLFGNRQWYNRTQIETMWAEEFRKRDIREGKVDDDISLAQTLEELAEVDTVHDYDDDDDSDWIVL